MTQYLLLPRAEVAELALDGAGVIWKHTFDQAASLLSQVDHDHAPIILLALTAHPAVLFEIVHNQGNVPATAQELLGDGVLAHGSEVEQGFEDAKLTHGQPLRFKLQANSAGHGIAGADQVDESVERSHRFPRTRKVRWHCASIHSNTNRSNLNDQTREAGKGFLLVRSCKIRVSGSGGEEPR